MRSRAASARGSLQGAPWGPIAALLLGAILVLQGLTVRRALDRVAEPLALIGGAVSAQRTRTTYPASSGLVTLETPRAAQGESVREWLERHCATVLEAQKVPSLMPRDAAAEPEPDH